MYEDLTEIARQLHTICLAKLGLESSREVEVSPDCGGDIEVTKTKIIIHPIHFTLGNPLVTISYAIELAAKFDRDALAAQTRAIAKAKFNLRIAIRDLKAIYPDAVKAIIEEETRPAEAELL